MCGIVGMTGRDDVVEATLRGLSLLEYRGYDSYGLASVTSEGLVVTKDVGAVGRALHDGRFADTPAATLALAHTRWATHGEVSQRNSHPHLSFDGKVAIVHNGVIENHLALRRELEAAGVTLRSETDSEVVAHLVARELEKGADVLDAVCVVCDRLTGEYALAIVSSSDPGSVYGAKLKSPLLVTNNGQRGMLASDQMATREISAQVMYLEDGDVVRLRPDGADIFARNKSGTFSVVERPRVDNSGAVGTVDKGPFEHYMLKEIHETPAAAKIALTRSAEEFHGVIPAESSHATTVIGSGSAFYVARIAQYILSKVAGVTAAAHPADEAEYLARLDYGDALIAISQSGETFDTLEVARLAKARGAVLTSVSNVPNSTMERLATHRIQQGAGPEVCVLSTKSIVSQVVLLMRLAMEHGLANGHLSEAEHTRYSQSLARLPETLRQLLDETSKTIKSIAQRFSRAQHWFFIGRGALDPVACESALKFKEVSYHHAEGMAAGFFKHGTISLIDADFYTVALLPSRNADPKRYHATLSNVSEIAARRGPVIGIGPSDATADERADFLEYISLPYHEDDLADIVIQLVAGQLLAYYCALELGREIDQPRSLAKSVTVR